MQQTYQGASTDLQRLRLELLEILARLEQEMEEADDEEDDDNPRR